MFSYLLLPKKDIKTSHFPLINPNQYLPKVVIKLTKLDKAPKVIKNAGSTLPKM